MLKKILLVAAVGLAVVGCKPVTIGGGGVIPPIVIGPSQTIPANTTTPTGIKVATVIEKVQTETRKYCKFVPTAGTVANVLGLFGVGDYKGLVDAAKQICNAVGGPGTVQARRKSVRPQVCKNGQCVLIQGARTV